MVSTLREDGHGVFHTYDGLSAAELTLALDRCDLLITDTRVDGVPGVDLIAQLRDRLPDLPTIYIANIGRSTPEIERSLPRNVLVLREPFSADELRGAVDSVLRGHAARSRGGDDS